ncbi:MAG: 3-deoxy-7-phosphoheptulonate synthase [Candidatus Hinthialibacter antarcticus]|nr:3-deoxy-7-phosphoheptulonate synthase [Candidatus Hinthialibacter antarcticus]
MSESAVTPSRETQDLHVLEAQPLLSPIELKRNLPMSDASAETVIQSRNSIKKMLINKDPRMLLIVGPCSIHDEKGAIEYARRLKALSDEVSDKLLVVMRVYFEKPRTTTGWKGLINDPHIDGSLDIAYGLHKGREILSQITEIGMPTATEFLDPIIPQYISDLISWAAIGARTTESQTHREMASGLSMPVGFKNNTDGNLEVAFNALQSARASHSFLGIDHDGRTAIYKTSGNRWGHIILRGGGGKCNYDPESIQQAMEGLKKADLPVSVMIDCSHANSGKKIENQEIVWKDSIHQRIAGNSAIIGLMLESNIYEGNQKITKDLSQLKYGVSITDACVNWETTETLVRWAHEQFNG